MTISAAPALTVPQRASSPARRPVLGFIARRLAVAIPLLLIVSMLTFVIVALIPGDPAARILGGTATAAQYQAIDKQLGLTQPLPVQYWRWLAGVFHGNLGQSIFTHQAVAQQISQRIGVTLTLVIGALLVAAVAGVLLGTLAALRAGAARWVTDVLTWLGFAVPAFWLGYLLVIVFAQKLRWFPSFGFVSFSASPGEWFLASVLPVVTLAVPGATAIAKQTRDAMDTALGTEYVVALRAQGVPESRVIFRHALRNAALPVLTMVGVVFVGTLSGSVLVEQVFELPGLGSLAIQSAASHDIPVIEGVVLCFAIIVVVVNLIVDALYGFLDPKVRAL